MARPGRNNLTNQETQNTIDVLENAIANHQAWLHQLHQSLICGQPFQDDVYREDAHRHCKLGQWYYHNAPDSLTIYKEFEAIEPIHARMHDAARELAQMAHRGEAISAEDYSAFVSSQQQLIRILGNLRDQLIETSYSFDPLTGAINRNAFYMIAEKEHALAERTRQGYVIAMIDLDRFKQINDRFGHLNGDQVLKASADIFQRRLRRSDIFCRFGGEEFIAFLPNTTLQDAVDMFESALRKLQTTDIPLDDSNEVIQITASIGLATYAARQRLETVIAQADAWLYEAKGQGRNRVCYPEPEI